MGGAQTDAAHIVHDTCETLGSKIETFGADLESYLPGVSGPAINIFGECLQGWVESCKGFLADLEQYAQALAAVDETAAATETQVHSSFGREYWESRLSH